MTTEHKTTEAEIKEIWQRLTAGESSIKSAHKRIDELKIQTKSISDLAMSTHDIAMEVKALREDYKKADERIEKLEEKPIKRYETVITSILTALCSGVVGYLIDFILN